MTAETEKLLILVASGSGAQNSDAKTGTTISKCLLLNTLCPLSERDAVISVS